MPRFLTVAVVGLLAWTCSSDSSSPPPAPPGRSQLRQEAIQYVVRPCFTSLAALKGLGESAVDALLITERKQIDELVDGTLMAVEREARFLFRLQTYEVAVGTCVALLGANSGLLSGESR